ncbi:MAG TPA: 4Fe-4S dicluster domain-containing protein [Armatimonadetes bacterium]|nr:4Fe-4S dicluster domain-containing protein [Armatimonadota bacterium]
MKKWSAEGIKVIPREAKWHELPRGGIIDRPGTALVYKTGGWRTFKPVWHEEKCRQCLICWINCPDGTILVDPEPQKMIGIDYDYCKGCGICAKVCPADALEMVKEGA